MSIDRVHIQEIDFKDPKEIQNGPNKGKPFWPIGVKINGSWYNGTAWGEEELQKAQAINVNQQQVLELYDEPKKDGDGVWKRWRFPKPGDMANWRMDEAARVIQVLDAKIEGLERRVAQLEKNNPKAAQ